MDCYQNGEIVLVAGSSSCQAQTQESPDLVLPSFIKINKALD